MADSIIMPKTGMAMESGVIVAWLKHEGDPVAKGEPIAEIETDKSTMELESDFAGIILKITREEGETVPVAETIAWIGRPGERIVDQEPAAAEPAVVADARGMQKKTSTPRRTVPATPAARSLAHELGLSLEAVALDVYRPYVRMADVQRHHASMGDAEIAPSSSPVARRVARLNGVDLAQMRGSGPAGRILKRDVQQWMESGQATAPQSGPAAAAGEKVVPLSRLQQIAAARLTRSHAEIPSATVSVEADVSALLDARRVLNERLSPAKVSMNDLLIRAAALALRVHPRVNSVFRETHLVAKTAINVNMAVDTDYGLMIPLVRNADRLMLAELCLITRALITNARNLTLAPADSELGTFTITNLGMFGAVHFTPILNPPQTAILGVCTMQDRLCLVDGSVQTRTVVPLVLAFDHRAFDGAEAARFLCTVGELLEEPTRLVGEEET
jgi:pyruvate dehydrogenase E2 component (dihydrolipoamide acetyltransferase)